MIAEQSHHSEPSVADFFYAKLPSIPELKAYDLKAGLTHRQLLTLAVECDPTWDLAWKALLHDLDRDSASDDIDEVVVHVQGIGDMSKADIRNLLECLEVKKSI